MPGSMIHLIGAKKVKPNGNALYFLGNIAPDAVDDRRDKDITHFRDLNDRGPALISLAKETMGDFAEGVLLHLYFDWRWDATILQKFIDNFGGDWFLPYRNELSLAGSYAFHHYEWAKQLWNDMDLISIGDQGVTPRASAEDVKNFISRNNKWNNENILGPSAAFPPDLIDDFTTQIADEFLKWKSKIY